jgi:hypothetical protein
MITAKIVCQGKTVTGEGDDRQAALIFHPNYANGEKNKEWARFTPELSLNMTVKGSVGDRFEVGQAFTLQFVEDEATA